MQKHRFNIRLASPISSGGRKKLAWTTGRGRGDQRRRKRRYKDGPSGPISQRDHLIFGAKTNKSIINMFFMAENSQTVAGTQTQSNIYMSLML